MLDRVGVRELRNHVAAVVRRAGAGERIIITVDGSPVAQLGPLFPDGWPSLDDLVASGLVNPPTRSAGPTPPEPIAIAVDAGLDRVIAEVRGE